MNWLPGHRVSLLEDGDEFFPRVFAAIEAAREEVLVETFIVFADTIGNQLRDRLIAAARRGVRTVLTADGYGSAELPASFVEAMTEAGVRVRLYDPQPRFLSMRINLFRRLHRKLVLLDGCTAFVGGINFSDDSVTRDQPTGKRDYAVEVAGPVCRAIRRLMLSTPAAEAPLPGAPSGSGAVGVADATPPHCGDTELIFAVRDNARHRTDIERLYVAGIRAARERVLIANAYFFPGYRLIRALRRAARRGVRVELILQGRPDMPLVRLATSALQDTLQRAGVRLYDYTERPLHAKVAIIDAQWATVGSSNLDPLSLFLNLEANLVIRGSDFNAALYTRLARLRDEQCVPVQANPRGTLDLGRRLVSFLAYHLVRRAPRLAGWLPAHTPRLDALYLPRSDEDDPLPRPGLATKGNKL